MAFLQAQGNIEPEEFARTFNCGVGMALIVSEKDTKGVAESLEAMGETAFAIGRVEAGKKGCTVSGSAETWSARSGWSASHD